MKEAPYWNCDLLAQWIDETGLSDEEFAARIGYARQALYRARKGRSASLELLGACAALCNKRLADLLTPETAKKFGILVPSS